MHQEIIQYNQSLSKTDQEICDLLAAEIEAALPDAENKIWHAHPVWFLEGNPIVGYSKLKLGIRLMFWSGADFDDVALKPGSGKFKDASVLFQSATEINPSQLQVWLKKSKHIQWDYKNVVKRKGKLEKLFPKSDI